MRLKRAMLMNKTESSKRGEVKGVVGSRGRRGRLRVHYWSIQEHEDWPIVQRNPASPAFRAFVMQTQTYEIRVYK